MIEMPLRNCLHLSFPIKWKKSLMQKIWVQLQLPHVIYVKTDKLTILPILLTIWTEQLGKALFSYELPSHLWCKMH